MQRTLSAIFNRLTIGIPYAWLVIFFLIPFFIVFKRPASIMFLVDE